VVLPVDLEGFVSLIPTAINYNGPTILTQVINQHIWKMVKPSAAGKGYKILLMQLEIINLKFYFL
jgi:hypothetical protein